MDRLNGFRLSDGQQWGILSKQPETKAWVDRFATILKASTICREGSHFLLFFRNLDRLPSLPGFVRTGGMTTKADEGWQVHNFRLFRIAMHEQSGYAVTDLGEEGPEDYEYLKMSLSLYPVYDGTIRRGGMPLHGALIERDGQGFVLCAVGGGGKSTCCQRLQPPWAWHADDETLLVRGDETTYRAHPLPTWSNLYFRREPTFCVVESHFPVRAICFLEQAPREELVPLGVAESTARIFQSSEQICSKFNRYFAADDLRSWRIRSFQVAGEIARKVSTYRLRVSLTGQFWKFLDKLSTD